MHVVVETNVYLRDASKLLSESEREEVVSMIAENPTVGKLIPETGGFRKVRVALQGGGKRGGARLIYYYFDENTPVFLSTIYGKNEKADLNAEERKTLKKIAAEMKRKYGG